MSNTSPKKNMGYDAILIDTCIYWNNDIALESGLLRKLNQFKWLPIDLLIPDIIEREIIPKLSDRIAGARRSIGRAVRQSKAHLLATEQDAELFEANLHSSGTEDELAQQRFTNFKEQTGAVKITCLDFADMKDVMNRYFDQKPPFGTKKDKKSEFPDAIILSAIESWAEQHNKKLLAVSTDKDWLTFAAQSERIDAKGDLAKGLAALQTSPEAFNFSSFLSFELLSNRANDITNAIEEHLSDVLPNLDAFPDASSSYYYEAEWVELHYSHFDYDDTLTGSVEVEPIHIEDNHITLDIGVTANLDAFCNFTFSVKDPIDKDYVTIGSLNAERQVELDLNVLVTLECDFTTSEPPFKVVEVELVKPTSLSIDFDYVDPAYDEDDYYESLNEGDDNAK